jgi:acyl-coenzyme A thioesterase PaaI-like protein
MQVEEHQPPEGWAKFAIGDPFQANNGPLYIAEPFEGTMEEPLRLGFRVAENHCGFPGICHGGMIAMVLDNAMGRSIQKACDVAITPTISLHIDYMNAASLGEWVESRVRLLHKTRRMVFLDALLVGPAGIIAKGSGVFKLPSSLPRN